MQEKNCQIKKAFKKNILSVDGYPSRGWAFLLENESHKGAKIAKNMNENQIGKIVIDSCIAIHKELGPGLLETVYEIILLHRLKERGLKSDGRSQYLLKLNIKKLNLMKDFGLIL